MVTPQPCILLVDDDDALLQALPEALALRMPAIQVQVCVSAVEALERIRQYDYDAIISDIKMPGMDGLALLTRIKELRPETPTLLITGHGEHDLTIQALRGGAYDFIQKPLDRDYFVAALQRAIQAYGLRRRYVSNNRHWNVMPNRSRPWWRNERASWWKPTRPKTRFSAWLPTN